MDGKKIIIVSSGSEGEEEHSSSSSSGPHLKHLPRSSFFQVKTGGRDNSSCTPGRGTPSCQFGGRGGGKDWIPGGRRDRIAARFRRGRRGTGGIHRIPRELKHLKVPNKVPMKETLTSQNAFLFETQGIRAFLVFLMTFAISEGQYNLEFILALLRSTCLMFF